MKDKHNPGDTFIVKVGTRVYVTEIDKDGVQRFQSNGVISWLVDMNKIDLNELALVYQAGKQPPFSQLDYLDFYCAMGYSVSGLSDLSMFSDLDIDNPLW